MNFLIYFAIFFLAIAILLILAILFFSFLKLIKRKYYPNWKFPDYVSVGYAEYLYHKYIKRDLK